MKFGITSARLSKKDLRVSLYTMKKKLQAKINVNTKFRNHKMPRERSDGIFLSVVLTDSVFKMGKSYYPQVFLEECKYIVKEKDVTSHIIEDLEISLDYGESDEE